MHPTDDWSLDSHPEPSDWLLDSHAHTRYARGLEMGPLVTGRTERSSPDLGDSLTLHWWTSGALGTRPPGYPARGGEGRRARRCGRAREGRAR